MAKYLVETYYNCAFKVSHYLDDINEVSKYWIKAQTELNKGQNKKIVFLKTHNLCCNYKGSSFTDLNKTSLISSIEEETEDVL